MSLTRVELETVIRFDETDEPVMVYTNNVAWKNRLAKLALGQAAVCRMESQDGFGGVTYSIPKKWLSVSPPRRMSDAQKERFMQSEAATRFKKKVTTP